MEHRVSLYMYPIKIETNLYQYFLTENGAPRRCTLHHQGIFNANDAPGLAHTTQNVIPSISSICIRKVQLALFQFSIMLSRYR